MLLRYLYPDGRLQAALPMRVVEDSGGTVVAWLSVGTQIEYWATADGLADPRTVPLPQRFRQALGHAPRRWEGSGVLRVIPLRECWQVLHFWNPRSGGFEGWYVNLESARQVGERIAQDPRGFLASIGDWRAFVPDSGWGPLQFPDGWDRNPTG
ncbi:MAG: hypothetical protein LKI27_06420 [Actinomyces sp.]|jgi:hypothetical protein|nr:hypothetical protein [Actinomyces sp.]MCI1641207.1 hypothetical protein [Actinomyces sp.]MCI1662516.1 hypothetical protein [Actinomyces sp.]